VSSDVLGFYSPIVVSIQPSPHKATTILPAEPGGETFTVSHQTQPRSYLSPLPILEYKLILRHILPYSLSLAESPKPTFPLPTTLPESTNNHGPLPGLHSLPLPALPPLYRAPALHPSRDLPLPLPPNFFSPLNLSRFPGCSFSRKQP
jgi:hypothetical protein